MLEALQSVANFRSTDVNGSAVSRGAVEVDRFDIDDPLDRRRRFERGQVAAGKTGRDQFPGKSPESGETDDDGRAEFEELSKASRKRDKEKARAEKAERRAQRKRGKREKREKNRREASDEDEGLAETRRGRDSKRKGKHSETKERSNGRSRHRSSSSSSSSSWSDEVPSSDDDRAERKRRRDKRRRKKQAEVKEKLRARSRKQPTDGKEDFGVGASAAPLESPEAVARAIVQKFAKVTDDLKLVRPCGEQSHWDCSWVCGRLLISNLLSFAALADCGQ